MGRSGLRFVLLSNHALSISTFNEDGGRVNTFRRFYF
jgi:hypothetical protein